MTRFSSALRALSSCSLSPPLSPLRARSRPPSLGGNSHIKMKFSTNTLKDTRILFDGRSSNGFLPLIGTSYKFRTYIFSAQYPKSTAINLRVVILDFSTLSGTNLQMVTFKRSPPGLLLPFFVFFKQTQSPNF